MPSSVVVIVNPISGTGRRVEMARARAERAAVLAAGRGLTAEVFVTERAGHARELTTDALARGARLVFAWGGDGTVNEVASALAFRDAALAIIPSGSGNGLARELGVPFAPDAAFAAALDGRARRLDAGELDGRLFFNVAGVGLDARIAHRFAADALARRGLSRYLAIAFREFCTYEPRIYTVTADGRSVQVHAMLVAIANARQYGNGAVIAPAARPDDGRLDLVMVAARSAIATLIQTPRLFMGRIDRAPGVTHVAATRIEIRGDEPLPYHVDGEPFMGGMSVSAFVRPGALRVMVPHEASGPSGQAS